MFRFAIEKPLIIAVGVLITCLFGILAVFRVPIQMIPDLDVRVVTVAISASILMSLLVATLVVPTLCSRFLSLNRAEPAAVAGLHVAGQRVGEMLVRFVHWLMEGRTRRVGLIIVVGCITLLIFASIPKAEYLPEGEE